MYPSPPPSKTDIGIFILFFVLSFLFHALVVFSVPDFLSVKRIKIIPVIYMKPMQVSIRNLPPLPAVSHRKPPPKKAKPAVSMEGTRFAMKKAQPLSAGKGLFLPPPSIQLPATDFIGKGEIPELYTSTEKNQKTLGKYPLKSGLPNALPEVSQGTLSLPVAQAENKLSEKILKELNREVTVNSQAIQKTEKSTKPKIRKASSVKLGVEGPISVRKVLYHPPLPKIRVEHSAQVKLKFWVTPNGIVDQIIPVERGGAKLESVAIRFLKGWRFEPLPAEVRQERQWGILTVKFLVK